MPQQIEKRRLRVCRGCCCGKKTGQRTNAEERLSLLVLITEIEVEVVTTECLGPCELGDVVVVMPTKQERLMGHRPIWFGGMHSVVLTNLLIQWLITDYPKNQERYPELIELKIKTRKQNIKELEIYEINAK